MCHNTNVLLANNILLNYTDRYADVLKKYGFPSKTVFSKWKGKDVENFFPTIELYKAWAAYAKGNFGETYVCDSDNAPSQLIKTLSNCDYSADVVDLIVTLNKSLDIAHARSDLAQAFIEGGQ